MDYIYQKKRIIRFIVNIYITSIIKTITEFSKHYVNSKQNGVQN